MHGMIFICDFQILFEEIQIKDFLVVLFFVLGAFLILSFSIFLHIAVYRYQSNLLSVIVPAIS